MLLTKKVGYKTHIDLQALGSLFEISLLKLHRLRTIACLINTLNNKQKRLTLCRQNRFMYILVFIHCIYTHRNIFLHLSMNIFSYILLYVNGNVNPYFIDFMTNCRTVNQISSIVFILSTICISVSITGHYNDVIMRPLVSEITSLTIVYSTVYWVADQRKYQSFVSLAFVRRIHRWPVNSQHKGPVTRKLFPFADVIMVLRYLTMDVTLRQTDGTDEQTHTHKQPV